MKDESSQAQTEQQAPVQPAPEQQAPQPQPMVQQQYVVMQKSLQGVGGWLIFWLIMFSLAAVVYIYAFFAALTVPTGFATGVKVVTLLFTPFLAIAFLAAVVMMSMQRKLGRLLAFATLGLSAVYTTVSSIVSYISVSDTVSRYSSSYSSYSSYDSSASGLPMLIGGILASLVIHGLIALYFILSQRVKETLVK